MAGPLAIRQSKTILARSCAALIRLLTCACARVVALSRRPKGEIFRAVEPGRENDPLASRGKFQDIAPSIPNGFRYEEITRRVKGQAMRIVKTGSERAPHACGSEHKNCIVWPVAQRSHKQIAAGVKGQAARKLGGCEGVWSNEDRARPIRCEFIDGYIKSIGGVEIACAIKSQAESLARSSAEDCARFIRREFIDGTREIGARVV